MTFIAADSTIDRDYGPAVVLSRDTEGTLTAVISAEGLEPTRRPNAEELGLGISSLDPLTVTVSDPAGARADVVNTLTRVCSRALLSAVSATTGQTLTAAGASAATHRLSLTLRRALRNIDEAV